MFKIPLPELKEKIKLGSNLTELELNERIKQKINDLSGLVSEEGAAHIIANELGLNLAEKAYRLKIKRIVPGMRDFEVLGKITAISEIKEFNKGEKNGKVGSFQISDESGSLRVVCWNDQTKHLSQLKENDIILVKGGYVKENNYNQIELHLSDRSELSINPEGEEIKEIKPKLSYQRKKIKDLLDGENGVEILGTIVQVFDPRFFNVCKECNKKVTEKEEGFYCNEHGQTEVDRSYVFNLILDDGSSTIRTVLWKNQTNTLLNKTEEQMLLFKDNPGFFDEIKTELLGEQFRIIGRISHNPMFDRLELTAQLVFKALAEEEMEKINSN